MDGGMDENLGNAAWNGDGYGLMTPYSGCGLEGGRHGCCPHHVIFDPSDALTQQRDAQRFCISFPHHRRLQGIMGYSVLGGPKHHFDSIQRQKEGPKCDRYAETYCRSRIISQELVRSLTRKDDG